METCGQLEMNYIVIGRVYIECRQDLGLTVSGRFETYIEPYIVQMNVYIITNIIICLCDAFTI